MFSKRLGLLLLAPSKRGVVFDTKSIHPRRMCGFVFRCGPLLSAGTASASSRNPLCGVFRHVLFPQVSTVLRSKQTIVNVKASYTVLLLSKHHVSEGNTRRLQRESEDDETPQQAFFASEEAHREPAESVVYFRSGLCRSLN